MENSSLWPMAMQHAVYLHNHTPSSETRLAPIELWSQSKSSLSVITNTHPWGCPTYVLQARLQNGQKIPRWDPRSRRGQYLGVSPLHASSVGLVRNPKTGRVSPQFHIVFDDWFETINCSTEYDPNAWQDK